MHYRLLSIVSVLQLGWYTRSLFMLPTVCSCLFWSVRFAGIIMLIMLYRRVRRLPVPSLINFQAEYPKAFFLLMYLYHHRFRLRRVSVAQRINTRKFSTMLYTIVSSIDHRIFSKRFSYWNVARRGRNFFVQWAALEETLCSIPSSHHSITSSLRCATPSYTLCHIPSMLIVKFPETQTEISILYCCYRNIFLLLLSARAVWIRFTLALNLL